MRNTVLIIDDEPIQREILKKYCMDSLYFKFIFEAKDMNDAEEILKKNNVDLLLMDIQMPYIIGTDWLSKNQTNIPVVLISAYENYAIKSYELNVTDYLLKPVSYERFLQSLKKLEFKRFQQQDELNSILWIKQGSKHNKILKTSINYIEAYGNYSIIHLEDKKRLIIYSSLKNLHEINKESCFIQIHRSFIINKNKITSIDKQNVYIEEIKIPIGNLYRMNITNLHT